MPTKSAYLKIVLVERQRCGWAGSGVYSPILHGVPHPQANNAVGCAQDCILEAKICEEERWR